MRTVALVCGGICLTLFILTAQSCARKDAQAELAKNAVYGAPEAKLSTEKPTSNKAMDGPALSIAPEVKPLVKATAHDVRIDVTHKLVDVGEGVKFHAWTFGDIFPGPVLRVREGDVVHFSMTNRSDQTVQLSQPSPHSIDFHAAMVSPTDKYREVIPGATITFDWTANYPGVFMYHCGSPAILQHMIYGMVGMTIVEPRSGYPTEVDREYALVQSELYLKKMEDGTYETDMETARKKDPMFVCFNGKPRQYVQKPLEAIAGERIRLFVCNIGPCGTSSFHVVGTLFDRVWFDGNPMNEMRGMQTVLLGASSGAIVEFVMPEGGKYPFVDHEFADVELGAVGLFNVSGGSGQLAAK
jgi:nitrite reductase (NO-forming)